MFLRKVSERNSDFLETVIDFHQNGKILPDTYVIDVDNYLENSRRILNQANEENIDLYFMLKQVGRNPYLAKRLTDMGYKGAVVVDHKEARVMMNNYIPIANAGHLVQIPDSYLQEVLEYGVDYMTVYSLDKIEKINEISKEIGIRQKLMVRVVGDNDNIYSGQTAGFFLEELNELIDEVKKMDNVEIRGITNFPCYLYDPEKNDIVAQENFNTLMKSKKIFEEAGIEIDNVNAPSTTSVRTLQLMKGLDIDSAEPGHGLSGTTPYNAYNDGAEVPAVLYLSEVSHNFKKQSYFYGGGYYRRGHLENALIVDKNNRSEAKVVCPDLDSIDYYFGLDDKYQLGSSVLMAFRFQMFVTRSDVCLVEGIRSNEPKIIGLYNGLGDRYE